MDFAFKYGTWHVWRANHWNNSLPKDDGTCEQHSNKLFVQVSSKSAIHICLLLIWLVKQWSGFISNDYTSSLYQIILYISCDNVMEHSSFATKQILFNRMKSDENKSKSGAFTYTSSAKSSVTIIQLWPDFSANWTIHGVKDSQRLLIITSKGNEWQNLFLVKERYFSGLKPWLWL